MTENDLGMAPEMRILRGCEGCRYKYDLKSEKCEECQAYEQWEAEDDK